MIRINIVARANIYRHIKIKIKENKLTRTHKQDKAYKYNDIKTQINRNKT